MNSFSNTAFITTINKNLFLKYGYKTFNSWIKIDAIVFVYVDQNEKYFWLKQKLPKNITIKYFSNSAKVLQKKIYTHEKKLIKKYQYSLSDFRYMASKFFWKVAAIKQAVCNDLKFKNFVWIDADIYIKRNDFFLWFQSIIVENKINFFGRSHVSMYAETGLLFIPKKLMSILSEIYNFYKYLDIFNLSEWHDAYIFTYYFDKNKSNVCDLSYKSKLSSTHPLFEIQNDKFFTHMKGDRKNKFILFTYILDFVRFRIMKR